MLIPYLRSRILFPLAEKLSGRNINERVNHLRMELARLWEQRERNNRFRLVEVLQNAKYEIPFYRDRFRKVGFEPLKVLDDIRYFEQLPVLTKEDIREAGDRLLNPGCQQYLPIHISRTNGSTGSALPIYYTPTSKDYSAAVTRISQEWIGFGPDQLQLHISSAFPDAPPAIAQRQEWWRQQATNRLSVECEAWTEEGFEALWRKVEASRAHLIQGHPSTAYAMARYVQKRYGKQTGKFKVFVSTGETLSLQQREVIEDVFGCRVANRYGNAEFGIIAHERFYPNTRSQGNDTLDGYALTPENASALRYMQIIDPYVWVESLAIAPGERGSILVTDLTNWSSPLIRYATGDEGTIVRGSDGLYLDTVAGRVHDQIEMNGKIYPTHWFQDMFTRLGNVDDFQFVRAEGKRMELRICLLNESGESAMRSRLAGWFPVDAFNIAFVRRHEFIRVGQQQKFRYLVDVKQMPPPTSKSSTRAASLFSGEARERPFAYLSGWNDSEQHQGTSYRWMCRRGAVAINPEVKAKTLVIEFDYPADVASFPMLTIMKNGIPIGQQAVKAGPQKVIVPLPSHETTDVMLIEFEVSSVYRAPGDYRELGLKVHNICCEHL